MTSQHTFTETSLIDTSRPCNVHLQNQTFIHLMQHRGSVQLSVWPTNTFDMTDAGDWDSSPTFLKVVNHSGMKMEQPNLPNPKKKKTCIQLETVQTRETHLI